MYHAFFNTTLISRLLLCILAAILFQTLAYAELKSFETSGPAVLSNKELNLLMRSPEIAPALKQKTDALLNTPFIYKDHSLDSNKPQSVILPQLGPTLRVASWNIERGFKLDQIVKILTPSQVGDVDTPEDINDQAAWLAKSQVILLTEVDNGMNRTQYRNTAFQLASSLHMSAVYGVEFLELGPLHLSNRIHAMAPEEKKQFKIDEYAINPQKYLGLHGSAILSKYPILNVQIIRLPDGYDWYHGEQNKLSSLEKVKRKAADAIFLENMLTEIRWGGRMALVVDVAIPELPEKKATFVVVHLENRAKPIARQVQMEYLLNALKSRHNPIVIGGDWNTTGNDVSPTSVKKELRERIKSPSFWSHQAINLLAPYGFLVNLGLQTTQFTKNLYNPAASDIPLIAPNPEKGLFTILENFQFDDQTCFDTRGDKVNTINKTSGFLANSNQKWLKGFVPTFSFERPIAKGIIGRYKLDWFIVKDYVKKTSDKAQPYLFAPHYARTLTGINKLHSVRISDHDPITIDLPLQESIKNSI